MATKMLVNIGSGNGLLPDGTKPLLNPVMTFIWSLVIKFSENLIKIHVIAWSIPKIGRTFSSVLQKDPLLPEASFGLRVLLLPACVYVCVCVRVSVNHEIVRAITRQPFKLGSPNLDQRCKRPWLRALLFCGMIDRDLQGQIELQSQNLPHFELVHTITHHQLEVTISKFGTKNAS